MSKKGPLSKAEAFYVEEKYKTGNSIEEISHELDRSSATIKKHVISIVAEQFLHQNGSTIITENASTMIDNTKKQSIKLNPNCVTKLK
jgi:DNA-binding NarL/FixJ family response regulator